MTAARVSQQVVEALSRASSNARVSQQVIEVLIVDVEEAALPLYPELAGLTYNTKWMPKFFNQDQVTTTGAALSLALAQYPLHEFELIYSVLRNNIVNVTYGGTEFKTMMGFFLQLAGTLGRFRFRNPDDYQVLGQSLGVTDGSTNVFPLYRTFGVTAYSASEPIGVVDPTAAITAVYLNGVVVNAGAYHFDTSVPLEQTLIMHNTPTANQALTIDMEYFYYCRFPTSNMTFEKFMQYLWELGQVVIESCRPGA